MKDSCFIEDIGKVTYQENTFIGKKRIFVDDIEIKKVKRYHYCSYINGKLINVTTYGNILKGCKLYIRDHVILVTNQPKWYEWCLGFLSFALSVYSIYIVY